LGSDVYKSLPSNSKGESEPGNAAPGHNRPQRWVRKTVWRNFPHDGADWRKRRAVSRI
jgi:hypothetical protein